MPDPLHKTIATEVRAQMGRVQVNGSELARQLGRSHTYVWRRLSGEVAFDLAELESVAEILGVPASHFYPQAERVA